MEGAWGEMGIEQEKGCANIRRCKGKKRQGDARGLMNYLNYRREFGAGRVGVEVQKK